MKSWKKRWQEELDRSAPRLRDDVMNAPLPADGRPNGGAAVKAARSPAPVVAAAVALLAACALLLYFFVIAPSKEIAPHIFLIEINPAVTLSTDGEGKVTGVISSNADADVILSADGAEEHMVGRDLSAAVTWYADTAAKLGYLDLDGSSAVRISAGDGEDESLPVGAKTALEQFFISKGAYAVVVCETVGVEEFKARSGISEGKTAKDVASYIAKSKTLFYDREAEGLTKEQLQGEYENKIVDEKLYGIVSGYLLAVEKRADDLEALWALYGEICDHEDNPAVYPRDYWTLKRYYEGETFSESFAALMAEMEGALAQYAADYGETIDNVIALREQAASFTGDTAEAIRNVVKDLSKDTFKNSYARISAILGKLGVETEALSRLIDLPETFEEYCSKTEEALAAEYGYREQAYASAYGKARGELTDYYEYVEGLEARYGSLSEYWKELKGGKK